MSKIIPVEKSETVYYGDMEHKNFWLKRNVSEIPSFQRQQVNFSTQNNVVCVMSENLTDIRIIKELFELAQQKCRVYILVNSISREMEELGKCCLIKENKGNIGSFILNVNEKTGFFWNGQITEDCMNFPSTFCLTLDEEQTGILYRHFCYYFWQSVPNSPMDIFPNLDNFCDSNFVEDLINNKRQTAFVSAIKSEIDSSKIITSLKGNHNSYIPQIARKGAKIFALEKGNFINLVENENGMFIIPKTNIVASDILWALKLNDTQKKQVKNYLQKIEENADYEFFISKIRAELENKYIMPLEENNNIHIVAEETKTLDDNVFKELLRKEEFEDRKPEFTDDGKSVQITFKWKNVPFYLPKDAKKHNLYANWENEIKKIKDFLDNILKRVDDTEKEETNFAKAIARLFLGKKTRFGSLKTEISELNNFDFSNASSDKLKEKINRINEISRQVANDIMEINEEDRKAKIEEEITSIKGKIAEKEEQAKNMEKERESHKAKIEEEIASIKGKIAEKEEFVKKFEQEKTIPNGEKETTVAMKSEIKELNSKVGQKEKDVAVMKSKFQSDIDKIKNEIKRLQGDVERLEKNKQHTATIQKMEINEEDRKAKIKEEITSIKGKIAEKEEQAKNMEKERESHKAKIEEEIASIKGKIAEKEEFVKKFEQETVAMKSKIKELNSKVGQKEKDVAVMKSKFQSDIDKIKNEIRRLQGDVERLEKSKQHTATTQNKESSLKVLDKNKSQNENKTELPIPELKFLPKIGTLYQFGGKDYLAIVDWNDFDSGEQERERLSAKLCAERS